ncbi:MAG TPA: putative maltokinase, partial [Chthoniobacteraceae bacterium]
NPKQYREARIIFKDFETSNWTWDPVAKQYFWHRFYSHQPDLNFENPVVHEALFGVIDFWLEMGVDGLRLDAVPYLYEREETNCENLPETHAFLKKLRAHIDSKFEDRMLLAEANQWPEDAAEYFGEGDECQMNFHFPLMPRLFMALQMEDRFPIIDILEQTPPIPANCQWATFLRNHDELTLEMVTDEERDYMYRVYASDTRARINLGIRRRLAPLLGNSRRRIELINSLLFSLPGTPIVYYGDEIGMGDNFYLGDRNGVRTPMQWSPDRNGGFSKANPQQLYLPVIIDPEYHYESVNVENQQGNLSSLFWWMRRMIGVRQQWRAFGHGTIEFLTPDNAKVLAYLRRHEDETLLVIANLSRFAQVAEIDLTPFSGSTPMELFSRSTFPEVKQGTTVFTMGPHDFYWLALKAPTSAAVAQAERTIPTLVNQPKWSVRLREELEDRVLPDYLQTCRWFGAKGASLRSLKIVDEITVPGAGENARVLLLEAGQAEGLPETYVLPLQIADGETAHRLLAESQQAVLAQSPGGDQVIYDAVHDEHFRTALLELVARGGARGNRAPHRLVGERGAGFTVEESAETPMTSHVLKADQSNTSILYGSTYFLKIYRKLERGPNPDVELTRFLSEEQKFPNVPSFAGSIRIPSDAGEGVMALLVGYTPNQGDAWSYTLDALDRYYERVLASRATDLAPLHDLIGGVYPERARQLGQRTGEMHLALAASDDHSTFAPEPFTTLYQRSLYQGMRQQIGRNLRLLRRRMKDLSEDARAVAETVVSSEEAIVGLQKRLTTQKIVATKTAIHGDYHLGQVLNTGKDFVIIDFEGEPRRSLGERNLKRSPLVDVAGMLRSFHYASHVALSRQRPEDAATLKPWGNSWSKAICAAFLTAYSETTAGASFIPQDPAEFDLLLEAFILDKAIYEVGYELTYRPDWAGVPLTAVCELLQKCTPEEIPAHVE